jgi:hypothetical protein
MSQQWQQHDCQEQQQHRIIHITGVSQSVLDTKKTTRIKRNRRSAFIQEYLQVTTKGRR